MEPGLDPRANQLGHTFRWSLSVLLEFGLLRVGVLRSFIWVVCSSVKWVHAFSLPVFSGLEVAVITASLYERQLSPFRQHQRTTVFFRRRDLCVATHSGWMSSSLYLDSCFSYLSPRLLRSCTAHPTLMVEVFLSPLSPGDHFHPHGSPM